MEERPGSEKQKPDALIRLKALVFVSALLLCLTGGVKAARPDQAAAGAPAIIPETGTGSVYTQSPEDGTGPVYTQSPETETGPSYTEGSETGTGPAADIPVPVSLPAVYSLVDQGKKPMVRSQGNTGTCWAISAVSAIESDLLPERRILLSADHMSIRNGFRVTQDDGGDYYMIMSYLADWKGPVLEEEDPYGDGISPEGLRAALHVQEIHMLGSMPRRAVKQMIMRYGAAQSSLCLNRRRTDTDEYHYYNASTCAYFDPLMEEVDHDILILGWDDTFSRDNFRIRPPLDGAWICQNTWGDSFGEDGIFYVSYEDRNLLRKGALVYSRIEDTDNYDRVYENDTLGWQGRQGYEGYECWFAGAYTAQSDEELRAVGLYSTGVGTVCEVYVIPRFEGEKDLDSLADRTGLPGADVFHAGGMTMDTAGYFTVDLDRTAALKAGQQFAVAVWIRTEGETKPVAVEMVKDRFTEPVTLEGRQTWISSDGKLWDNTQSIYQTNVCLKAYTVRTGRTDKQILQTEQDNTDKTDKEADTDGE